jgi:ribosome-associated toxin RatA of RatAB toxin-antitoxin module
MAELETTHIFVGSKDRVFRGISRFDQYPTYIPGVTKVEVGPATNKEANCLVRYELNIIKSFFYTLEMFEKTPDRLWWSLKDSNLMKQNNGSWEFEALGKDKTKAVYRLDIKFKGLVPSMITDQIAKANLPLMFGGFQKLIDNTP